MAKTKKNKKIKKLHWLQKMMSLQLFFLIFFKAFNDYQYIIINKAINKAISSHLACVK